MTVVAVAASQPKVSAAGAGRAGASGLFAAGPWSEHAERFRSLVAQRVSRDLLPLVEAAERDRRFPRTAITRLASTAAFRQRWDGSQFGDVASGIVIAEELGRGGTGGLGIGVSVHLEAVLSMLVRYGQSDELRALREAALAGRAVGCVATSEDSAGSDLTSVQTVAQREGDGWHVHGTKAFVSLGAAADFALVLARVGDDAAGALGPPLLMVCVPRDGLTIERRLEPVGARALETVRLRIDARVPAGNVLGRPGRGLAVASWGLAHERLATAAFVVGSAQLMVALAVAHAHRRVQFGRRLIEHQAVRLRLAELTAEVRLARTGLYGEVLAVDGQPSRMTRASAGLKVTIARLGERVASECMQLFGGRGFIETETPLARLWRDLRLARLGGGSDEMMWELVARGLAADGALYDAFVGSDP